MAATHVLFESAVGYALYEVRLHEEIGQRTTQVQEAISDVIKFGAMVGLKGFLPFKDAAHALENANDVSEGEPHLNGSQEQAAETFAQAY
jgi:nucleolar protein 56